MIINPISLVIGAITFVAIYIAEEVAENAIFDAIGLIFEMSAQQIENSGLSTVHICATLIRCILPLIGTLFTYTEIEKILGGRD